jgi:hypothetical protein
MSFDNTIPCPQCGEKHHPDFMAYHLQRQCVVGDKTAPVMAKVSIQGVVPPSGKQSRRDRRAKQRLVKKLFVTVRKPGYESEQEKARKESIKLHQSMCSHPAFTTNTGHGNPSTCVVCGKPSPL